MRWRARCAIALRSALGLHVADRVDPRVVGELVYVLDDGQGKGPVNC